MWRPALLLLLALTLLTCGGNDDDDDTGNDDDIVNDDDTVDETRCLDDEAMGLEIDEQTGALTFSWNGKTITAVADGDAIPYGIGSEFGDWEPLVGPVTVDHASCTIDLQTEDGRAASISLEPGEEDSIRLRLTIEGREQTELLGLRFEVTPDEGFYGLMERVVQGSQDASWQPGMTEAFDLRGQDLLLYTFFTLSIYSPFYLSSAGYGVHVESDWPGHYRFGTDEAERVELAYEGPELPLRIIPGPTTADVVQRYSRAHPAILPPDWTFGHWRWRDHDNPATYYDGSPVAAPYNAMLVEDILMMDALEIPADLIWVDRPWAQGSFGYDDFTWDPARFPDAPGMIDWLNGRGVEFLLWIAPWVMGPETVGVVEQNGWFVEGAVPLTAGTRLLDFTNDDAVEWWQNQLIELIGTGVRGFKLDRAEEQVPDGIAFRGNYHDGTSYREGHNRYPEWYAAAVHGAFERAGVEEYVVMPRAAWAGSQEHAIFWGGDTLGSAWGLRSAIIAVQRAAVMNFPVWGSDTCGYNGWEREPCLRWMAFSAFCPLMEVGPTRDRAPWSLRLKGGGYDHELVATWAFYARLHQHIKDYTATYARLASETGMPIVRPMILAESLVEEQADRWDQYLYGPDILVAPVWEEGVTEREVWIPGGHWVDAWTGEPVDGRHRLITADATRPRIPIYQRAETDVLPIPLEEFWQKALSDTEDEPEIKVLEEGEWGRRSRR